MNGEESIKNKKVLLVGFGTLGGGEALAKFLLNKGARLTITDLKNEAHLKNTLKKFKKGKIKFVLGKHQKIDFKNNDIIFFNPGVSIFSPWVKLAKKYKKLIENDLTLFLELLQDRKPEPDYIAITGTKGKTTTAIWLNHFLKNSALGGNMPSRGLFKIIKKKVKLFILEISSFQMEFMRKKLKPPKVAVITNLFVDHLNRHKTLKNYIKEKSKIFMNQKKSDFLVLNADNIYTEEFLRYRPKSKVYFFSLKPLAFGRNGLFLDSHSVYFIENKKRKFIFKMPNIAVHQKSNLLASILIVYLYKKNWDELLYKIKTLPEVSFREEIIFDNKKLKIINDTTATNPDGTIVALERFSKTSKGLVLIIGGTDKNLKFKELADKIKKYIKKRNLFLLNGSATKKLIQELKKNGYFKKNDEIDLFENIKDILIKIKMSIRKGVILFSPGSASFEKFKNEFDRGKKFNILVKSIFKD